MMPSPRCYKPSGFTLIELSIILVIIGLIAGGILVGQDLIKAAKNRQQISQLVEFTAATNTFKLKYNGWPGDIKDANSLGLHYSASWPHMGNGNGNINDAYNASPPIKGWGENYTFFIHLSQAKLISEQLAFQSSVYNWDDDAYSKQFPKLKVGIGAIMASSLNNNLYLYLGINKFHNGGIPDITVISDSGVLFAEQAFFLDEKLDDGKPGTGNIIAVTSATGALDTTDGNCVRNTASEYNLAATTIQCRLYVKAK